MSDIFPIFAADEDDEERLRAYRQMPHTNPSAETPPTVPPLFSSAEIGTVNNSTVVVTFDQDITASNYATGVTIKKGGVTQTISSATRQANHAVVHYVLASAAYSTDTLTWEYTGGNIAAEDDGAALGTVTAQAVTNNITLGDDLRRDAVAYWTMNEASGTRSDSAGSRHLNEVNNTASAAGKQSNATGITDENGYFRTSQSNGLRFGSTSFVLAFWLKITDLPDFEAHILIQSDLADADFEYGLYTLEGTAGTVDLNLYTVNNFIVAQQVENPGDWHYIIIERDEGTAKLRIYVDNTMVSQSDIAAGDVEAGDYFSFGATTANPAYGMVFAVDEFLALGRVATADERAYLYNSGSGRTLYP